MVNLKNKIVNLETYKSISDYLPEDHSQQQSLHQYVSQIIAREPIKVSKVLDLGCGEGNSVDLFHQLSADATWYGVDIEDSPEVRLRSKKNDLISSFNGVDLPYPANYFDLIFCQQVLEHVRHPDKLINDVLRVLKPGGLFISSVSYLEPYHSYSIFNFTPYGIVRVFVDAGFELIEIRPGVDASVLINRQLFNRSKILSPIWKINFLYTIINTIGRTFKLKHRECNFLKIQFSGHIVFFARKPVKNDNEMS